jgi:hypothetical protein
MERLTAPRTTSGSAAMSNTTDTMLSSS